jgi:hypothetical protein
MITKSSRGRDDTGGAFLRLSTELADNVAGLARLEQMAPDEFDEVSASQTGASSASALG